MPQRWAGSGAWVWPLLAGGLLLAEPGGRAGLHAQGTAYPTLSCVTGAVVDATLSRTPLLRFTGALPPGDTIVFHVEWLPVPSGVNPQRLQIEARRADTRTECASRRRLVVELDGRWRSDSITLRVAGSPAFELQGGANARTLRVPRPAAAGRRNPSTRCVMTGAAGGPTTRCGPAGGRAG